MKIKTVCDVTGLTDRTIRYYIEEQLISPAYTENYLGRKSFDFSQEDIDTLKNISVLRKFDFAITEIRRIIEDENASSTIIFDVKHRTEEAVSVGKEKLLVLSRLHAGKTYSLKQLAEELSKPEVVLPDHKEVVKRDPLKTIWAILKSLLILAIVWAPVAMSLFGIIISLSHWHYPVFNHMAITLVLLSYCPCIGVLIISKTQWKWKKAAKRILLALCVLSIPISFLLSFGVIARSETTDILNYRRFDADCLANRHSFFQDLFPTWPHYSDAHYLYRNLPAMDYTYDIYAEWPLEKEQFDKEVSRVQALYEGDDRNYVTVQKGNYTCLILYHGDFPFQEVTDSYTYYIFAYDETNLIVRYIICDSLENGADQPFYLSLDWE